MTTQVERVSIAVAYLTSASLPEISMTVHCYAVSEKEAGAPSSSSAPPAKRSLLIADRRTFLSADKPSEAIARVRVLSWATELSLAVGDVAPLMQPLGYLDELLNEQTPANFTRLFPTVFAQIYEKQPFPATYVVTAVEEDQPVLHCQLAPRDVFEKSRAQALAGIRSITVGGGSSSSSLASKQSAHATVMREKERDAANLRQILENGHTNVARGSEVLSNKVSGLNQQDGVVRGQTHALVKGTVEERKKVMEEITMLTQGYFR